MPRRGFYSDRAAVSEGRLLFDIGSAEVNIFSNGPGPGTYQFFRNNGANDFGDFALTEVAVSEPATWAMMLFGVGMIGGEACAARKLDEFPPLRVETNSCGRKIWR